jgi:hypothetical protein
MKAGYKRGIWAVIALIYFASALTAYFLQIDFILFFLTIPWSLIITMLGMLLIHMFSYDLSSYFLVGALLNVLILIKIAVLRYYD